MTKLFFSGKCPFVKTDFLQDRVSFDNFFDTFFEKRCNTDIFLNEKFNFFKLKPTFSPELGYAFVERIRIKVYGGFLLYRRRNLRHAPV